MKLLLHICCGPCATATVKKLQEEGYKVVGYYNNPNIHPNFEYKKRLGEAKKLAKETGVELIVEKYNPKSYFDAIKGNEGAQKERCPKCWELRIQKTAQKAKALGMNSIATTLRISPYQDQKNILRLGKEIAQENGLTFYEQEIATCFTESVKMSKERGMYRQKYCGCIFSREYR